MSPSDSGLTGVEGKSISFPVNRQDSKSTGATLRGGQQVYRYLNIYQQLMYVFLTFYQQLIKIGLYFYCLSLDTVYLTTFRSETQWDRNDEM